MSEKNTCNIYDKVVDIVGEENVHTDEPMSRHTTFRIGGNADYFVKPGNADEVAAVIVVCREYNIPYFILGNGSNLLVSDDGYRGMIINIMDNMDSVTVDGRIITAQAGAMLVRVSVMARDNALTGLEFASGIPGTIGGAVYMNAGAYGGEMKNIVKTVRAIDEYGRIYELDSEKMDFSYRHSIVEERKLIVLEVTLELEHGSREAIDDRMKELAEARRSKQPLEYPSAGSTFKRPEGYFAGKLIMDAGLRGYSVGGAQVAEKHCGFVINKGGATASDVVELIRDVQHDVDDKFGVTLEPEVKMLGEF
jgi:UDP-N-acetylmuramate dehydrogenase